MHSVTTQIPNRTQRLLFRIRLIRTIELIYRTGDLARYNENGELVFSGRKDFQIKYMGHRIELEEIEREMSAVDGVEQCCCIFDEKNQGSRAFRRLN